MAEDRRGVRGGPREDRASVPGAHGLFAHEVIWSMGTPNSHKPTPNAMKHQLSRSTIRRWAVIASVWVLGLGSWEFAYGQFGFGRGDSNMPARMAPAEFPDRNFAVCRLMYTQVRREPSGG